MFRGKKFLGDKKFFRGVKLKRKEGRAKKRKKVIKKNLGKGRSKKKTSSRPKVGKHAQMGQFEHILENAGSGYEGEIWKRGGKTRIHPGRQVP